MYRAFICERCGKRYSRNPKKIDLDRGYNKYCSNECKRNQDIPYVGGIVEECFCICGNPKAKKGNQCGECYREWIPVGVHPDDEHKRRRKIISESKNRVSAAIEIGCTPLALGKYIKRHGVDTSHFSHQPRGRKRTEDIFVDRTGTTQRGRNNDLRRYILERDLLEYKCECGNEGWHEGKPLQLQVDHINGNFLDDRLENLRFLCPNCHSQTDTFAWKNSKRPALEIATGDS